MKNKHKVYGKVWRAWSETQRELFTALYERMIASPWAFQHPEAAEITGAHWETVAWNAAWMAADMLTGVTWLAPENLHLDEDYKKTLLTLYSVP